MATTFLKIGVLCFERNFKTLYQKKKSVLDKKPFRKVLPEVFGGIWVVLVTTGLAKFKIFTWS